MTAEEALWRKNVPQEVPTDKGIKGKPFTRATAPESRLALKNQAQERKECPSARFCISSGCNFLGFLAQNLL